MLLNYVFIQHELTHLNVLFDHSDQTAAIKMYEKPGCSGKMRKNGYGGRRQKGIESEGIPR